MSNFFKQYLSIAPELVLCLFLYFNCKLYYYVQQVASFDEPWFLWAACAYPKKID